MAIIPSWLVPAVIFASVHSQEAGKYILVDADDLGLTSTLFINEDRTANWMFQCNFAGYTRPYLVGPFPLHEDTPSQFIIDYGGPLMPALMRQHCPPIEGIVDTDFSMIRFLTEDNVTTTIRNKSMRFPRVDNSYITPYVGRPSSSWNCSNCSSYEFLYIVLGHDKLQVILWVACGDSPSAGASFPFRLNRDESNPLRVEYVMSSIYKEAFEHFKVEVHAACDLSISSDDLQRVLFATPKTMFTNFQGRRVRLTTI